jgi:uncharacterized protein YndB with AHSA1/START domain
VSGLPDLVKEITVQAPVAKVYDAWRSSERLSRWFAPEANAHLEEGAPFEFFWDPANHEENSTIGCKVLSLREHDQITFSWKGPVPFAPLMNQAPLTTVTFAFIPQGQSTQVRLTHRGWGDGPGWTDARAWHDEAWDEVLRGLKEFVEEGSDAKPYWAG